MALLQPGDTVLGMNLAHGGHLTHGHPLNFSGKLYSIVPYGVRRDDERIDYDEIERLAHERRPKMIIVITQPACLRRASAAPRISRKIAKPIVPPSIGMKIVEYASTSDAIQLTLGKIAWSSSTRAAPKYSRDTRKGSLGIRRVIAFGRLRAASTGRSDLVSLSVPLVTAPLLPSPSRRS